MQNQPGPDFQLLFEHTPTPCMAINKNLEIVAVSNSFLAATLTSREKILGKKVIEVFPDNPQDHFSKSSTYSRQLMQNVFDTGQMAFSKIDKYDIPGPDGSFIERFWKDVNIPVLNVNNELEWVLHCTEDITDSIHYSLDKTDWANQVSESSTQAEELRLLSGYLHNDREEERSRIAREIHDGLGQQLSVIKMDVNWISRRLGEGNDAIKEKIKEINSMLNDTVRMVRHISAELRPSLLDDMGLFAAIEWQMGELQKRSSITTHFENTDQEPALSDTLRLNLFRIAQECISNVIRHAGAKNIWVSLSVQKHSLKLSIKDDGIGFDTSKKTGKTMFGLLSMKERTKMIGGKYSVTSSPEDGTVVEVLVNM